MNHSFFSRCKLKECSEFFDADYFSFKKLSCFKVCYDRCDQLRCFFHRFFFCTADRNCSIVCDIDLHSSLLDDRIDRLSSLSDNIADLLWVDLHLNNLRCISSHFFSRFCNCFIHHFIQNVSSCFLCRCDCFFNDWSCQSVDLNVHLDRCDTLVCTSHFKVHISEEIFQSLDICKNQIIIVCLSCHQTC